MTGDLEEKKGKGCPTKYREEFVGLVRAICEETRPTDKQLCKILGKFIQEKPLSQETFATWRKTYPDFNDALITGRDAFNSRNIEKSLVKIARGFHFTEVTKEPSILRLQGKTPLIVSPTLHVTKKVRKFIPPNQKSIEYFLDNRAHLRWKSRQIHEITGKDGNPLTVTHEARLNAIMDEVREIESQEAKEASEA